MQAKITIQQLTPQDAAAFQALRLFALQESPAAFGSSYNRESERPLTMVAERLQDADNHMFGARDESGQLIGMVILRRDGHVKSGHKAFVFSLYVLPDFRQQGIGRQLMESVIRRAKALGLKQLNLSVVTANEAAVHLYQTCGFREFGLEQDGFRIDDDFYDVAHMALRLDDVQQT